jgi:hypothetical protein
MSMIYTCILPCTCMKSSKNLISGGAIYNSAMDNSKKVSTLRCETLKRVMPQKEHPECTILDVLRRETSAIKKTPTFSLTLKPDMDQLKYRRRLFELKGVIHWGQLKLMLSEIQFLSEYGHLSNTIVYAGSAPGTHIKFLSKMFPKHKFILWDPRAFDVSGPMIETHEEFFTDEVAQTYAGKDVLFVSDIRTGDSEDVKCNFEGRVSIDMEWQMTWHKIIRPSMGMYKFRLPYESGKTSYMDGVLQLQVFAPISTTELRLIVPQDMKLTMYDNDTVEEQMYHFNSFVRPKWFGQSLRCCHLDGCWDCTAMIAILKMYLNNVKRYKYQNTKAGNVMMQQYVKSVLSSCSRVNKLNDRFHGDGSTIGWFERMHKYTNIKADSTKIGNVVFEKQLGEYKKIITELKKLDKTIITSPILIMNNDKKKKKKWIKK